ncbi:hypothetical protein B0181_04880 [Moraxella caviae]|uniref:FAD-binding domain-containing protein n=1 Tax=Moraxella caviae TaxID=34060 RepID=A0A1T0A3V7_9GAMM|nr:hypothetical protein B0181_04880 [Moraxella caviae]
MQTTWLIVGGGAVGLTLALSLAKRGQYVCVIDAKPEFDERAWQEKLAKRDARVFALSRTSVGLLDEIGVYDALIRKADYTQMHVWQGDGRGELRFAAPSLIPESMGCMVEPAVLEYALLEKAKDDKYAPFLSILHGTTLLADTLDVQKDGITLKLQSNDNTITIKTKMLIGADGRASVVRSAMGIACDRLDYGQIAICCAIRTEKPHQNTARQAMLPTGTLALLPLANLHADDNDLWQSVVWTLPSELAKTYLALSYDELAQKLALTSGFELGQIHEIQSVASFPLSAQAAKSYTAAHTLLMGDAAHGVHPLAGQGLNLGFLDIKALLEILTWAQARNLPINHPAVLARYERARRGHNALMMHGFSAINAAFASSVMQYKPLRFMRSEAVRLVGKSPSLLAFFNRQAGGV